MKIYRSKKLHGDVFKESLKKTKLNADFIDMITDEINQDDQFHQNFDIIEMDESAKSSFIDQAKELDWEVSALKGFDVVLKKQNHYKPYNLGSVALKSYIETRSLVIDSTKSAVLVGEYSFLVTYALALSQLGFKKIYIVSPENLFFNEKLANVQKILFDVKIQQISYDEMANTSEISSVLIVDFDLASYPEMVEILTYFNFLAQGSLFLDLNHFYDPTLYDEAEKADLGVISSVEFHHYRYEFAKNILNNINNSTKV